MIEQCFQDVVDVVFHMFFPIMISRFATCVSFWRLLQGYFSLDQVKSSKGRSLSFRLPILSSHFASPHIPWGKYLTWSAWVHLIPSKMDHTVAWDWRCSTVKMWFKEVEKNWFHSDICRLVMLSDWIQPASSGIPFSPCETPQTVRRIKPRRALRLAMGGKFPTSTPGSDIANSYRSPWIWKFGILGHSVDCKQRI